MLACTGSFNSQDTSAIDGQYLLFFFEDFSNQAHKSRYVWIVQNFRGKSEIAKERDGQLLQWSVQMQEFQNWNP